MGRGSGEGGVMVPRGDTCDLGGQCVSVRWDVNRVELWCSGEHECVAAEIASADLNEVV